MKGVNRFTEYCLQLDIDYRKDTKGAAAALYAQNASDDRNGLPKEIEPERTARRNRLAFLYVAERYDHELLDCPTQPAVLWRSLQEKTKERDRFDLFFAHCAYVQNVLAHGSQFTGEHIAEWAGVSPKRPPSIEKLTSADLLILEQFAGNKRGGKPQKE